MSMVPNEEQVMLRDSAAEYFSQHASVEDFRKLRSTPAELPGGQLQALAEFGWTGILVPEEFGGLGFGVGGLALIAIEAGRNLSITPLFSNAALAVNALLQCCPTPARDELLASIAAGESRATLAWNEQAHFNARELSTHCATGSDGMSLTGSKPQVQDLAHAEHMLVVATCDGQPVLTLLDAEATGICKRAVTLLDRRDYQDVSFDNVPVDASFKWRESADDALQSMLDCGALLAASELYGICREVFERTRVYLIERTQFDRPIGSFQALQHRMAQAYAQVELLKSVLFDAISACETQRRDKSLAVSHAKTLANQTTRLVSNEAIQLHGGMGITDELDIGLFYKRGRVLQNLYGNEHFHRTRFATLSGY